MLFATETADSEKTAWKYPYSLKYFRGELDIKIPYFLVERHKENSSITAWIRDDVAAFFSELGQAKSQDKVDRYLEQQKNSAEKVWPVERFFALSTILHSDLLYSMDLVESYFSCSPQERHEVDVYFLQWVEEKAICYEAMRVLESYLLNVETERPEEKISRFLDFHLTAFGGELSVFLANMQNALLTMEPRTYSQKKVQATIRTWASQKNKELVNQGNNLTKMPSGEVTPNRVAIVYYHLHRTGTESFDDNPIGKLKAIKEAARQWEVDADNLRKKYAVIEKAKYTDRLREDYKVAISLLEENPAARRDAENKIWRLERDYKKTNTKV